MNKRPTIRKGDRNVHVEHLQKLLNKVLTPSPELVEDGDFGRLTKAAVKRYQKVKRLKPDGIVGDNTWRLLSPNTVKEDPAMVPTVITTKVDPNEPPWIKVARAEAAKGIRELKGWRRNSQDVLKYLATCPALKHIEKKEGSGVMMSEVDESAWCACFVNWCMIQAGFPRHPGKGANPSRAKQWVSYGTKLTVPRYGAICVIYKKPVSKGDKKVTASGNHVGFWTGGSGNAVKMLGGNQGGGRVCEKTFTGWKVLGYAWPDLSGRATAADADDDHLIGDTNFIDLPEAA